MSDVVLIMSLVVACCAVVLIAIQAPLQRRALREIADRNRLDMISVLDEVGSVQMRIDALDRSLQRIVHRVDQLQLQQVGSAGNAGYDEASTLARGGASIEQLIE
ncbi:MAG: hypothetical protein KJO55_07935, partial [Gammaproteobacteria bacterium]|nr:hypothetical protein [Gammaproteobacteria bacterium]